MLTPGVIILLPSILRARNGKKLEINSAVWNEKSPQSSGVCVVQVKLDDSHIPPVLGRKVYGKVDVSDPTSYRNLLEDLCSTILFGKTRILGGIRSIQGVNQATRFAVSAPSILKTDLTCSQKHLLLQMR